MPVFYSWAAVVEAVASALYTCKVFAAKDYFHAYMISLLFTCRNENSLQERLQFTELLCKRTEGSRYSATLQEEQTSPKTDENTSRQPAKYRGEAGLCCKLLTQTSREISLSSICLTLKFPLQSKPSINRERPQARSHKLMLQLRFSKGRAGLSLLHYLCFDNSSIINPQLSTRPQHTIE